MSQRKNKTKQAFVYQWNKCILLAGRLQKAKQEEEVDFERGGWLGSEEGKERLLDWWRNREEPSPYEKASLTA